MIENKIQEEIANAIDVLRKGGTILYPTDTVWGLGCDATNEEAVSKVFKIKKREEAKSLIILLDEDIKLNKYVRDVPEMAWDLIELSDTPLTIIYSEPYNLAKNVINIEDNTVGIRIVKEEFCRQLIRKFNKPLVSTSANISGGSTPSFFKDISPEIISSVDYVVNLRQQENTSSKPSSIIKIGKRGEVQVIRK
jgi:L-threonylcarbamoyladenylate synthase